MNYQTNSLELLNVTKYVTLYICMCVCVYICVCVLCIYILVIIMNRQQLFFQKAMSWLCHQPCR